MPITRPQKSTSRSAYVKSHWLASWSLRRPSRRLNGFNWRWYTDYCPQTGSLLAVGGFFGSVLVYQFVPKEGEQSSILSLIDRYTSRGKDWEDINALHTKAMEQAGYDRNLFENGGNKHRFVDVAYPEFVHLHTTCRQSMEATTPFLQ
jgi:hypothetical protein